jgi:uncharacterized protein (UPF0548 family)
MAEWSRLPASSGLGGPSRAITDRYTVTVRPRPGESPHLTFARLRERLMVYDIYPRVALLFAIDPCGPVVSGATIVQRVQFGFGAIEAGVRVLRVWDSPGEAGFTYVTLRGHPERGVESFGLQLQPDGRVRLRIEARSRPGHPLTAIGLPVARAVQLALTQAAVRRLAS